MADARIPELAQARYQQTLDLLKQIVEFESPSSEKQAVDRLIDFLQSELERREAAVERIPQDAYGDLLIARWPGDDREPLFVMTHVDTVWPVGTLERLPWKIEGDVGRGPGIYDMKASVAMMFGAVDILKELGHVRRPIIWLINTDEEIGSPGSRPHIERYAKESAYVLCLEPPVPPDDALKTERKGVGVFGVEISGVEAHSGLDPEKGASAVDELARAVLALHGLTDREAGTSVNVGTVTGGTRANVVAGWARAVVDIRVRTSQEAARVEAALAALRPRDPRVRLRVTGGWNRPVMERGPETARLFGIARDLAAEIGVELRECSVGGASDGNFAAATGTPVLDGFGAVGDGAHSRREHVSVEGMIERTTLAAGLIHTLATWRPLPTSTPRTPAVIHRAPPPPPFTRSPADPR